MGREWNNKMPCPECESENVERTKLGEVNNGKLETFTELHCYHCGHDWRTHP